MNKLKLLKELRRHIKLSAKRSLAYEQNKTAKVIIYIGLMSLILYLVMLAVMFALIANDPETYYTPYEFLFGLAPFLLTADFLLRFIGQQTPTQLIKPYSLLPIPKYTCIELFIFSSIISPNNLIWMAFTIPYAIMTTLFSEGVAAMFGIIISFQLLVTINSLWYMLARTLINQNLKWWLLPIAVYAIIFSPIYIKDIDAMFNIYTSVGKGMAFWHPLYYTAIILILVMFFEINKRLQFKFTYLENSGAESRKMRTVSQFNMLNRYGETGEYIKLEMKSLMRNKNMRKSFMYSTMAIVILSLLISFTDITQNNSYNETFWVVYTFIIYGATMLVKIMGAEGNYIDCLMIHKENIIQLIKAKYYFYGAMLVLPFLLMLPTVFTGKYSLLMLVAMACFTAGPIYFMFMQMAVYNKQTMPLNTKFVSKGNVETNYFLLAAELISMFCPVILILVLRNISNEDATDITLLAIGLAFILTHNLWIKNIYKRFMKRRYANMDSLRATR